MQLINQKGQVWQESQQTFHCSDIWHLTWTPARGLSWHMHSHDAWTLITGLCRLSVTRTLDQSCSVQDQNNKVIFLSCMLYEVRITALSSVVCCTAGIAEWLVSWIQYLQAKNKHVQVSMCQAVMSSVVLFEYYSQNNSSNIMFVLNKPKHLYEPNMYVELDSDSNPNLYPSRLL